MKWLSYVLYAFAAIMLAMGIDAVDVHVMSLVGSIVIAILACTGAWLGMKKPTIGYSIGLVSALLPIGQFGRSLATKGFVIYPAFVGVLLSVIVILCCVAGHFMSKKQPVNPV